MVGQSLSRSRHLSLVNTPVLCHRCTARTGSEMEVSIWQRALGALLAARLSPGVRYVFDTFMDVDRGYFPRNGFIDRMFNPRPALRAYAGLASLLGRETAISVEPTKLKGTERAVRFHVGGTTRKATEEGARFTVLLHHADRRAATSCRPPPARHPLEREECPPLQDYEAGIPATWSCVVVARRKAEAQVSEQNLRCLEASFFPHSVHMRGTGLSPTPACSAIG